MILRRRLKSSISFDPAIRFERFFHRWKEESLSFQTVQKSLKTDGWIERYGRFKIHSISLILKLILLILLFLQIN